MPTLGEQVFEQFRAAFGPSGGRTGTPFTNPSLSGCPGFAELASECGGTTFGDGLIRVHSAAGAARADRLIEEAFPDYAGDCQTIAQDWMGRQFAVGARPGARHFGQLLLFEPASGDAFEVGNDIPALFNQELPADPVGYLSADLLAEWRDQGGTEPGPDQCLGWKVPFFLGGQDTVDDLEIVDLEVYWSIFGQLRARTKDLPPGTPITGISIDPPA